MQRCRFQQPAAPEHNSRFHLALAHDVAEGEHNSRFHLALARDVAEGDTFA